MTMMAALARDCWMGRPLDSFRAERNGSSDTMMRASVLSR